MLPAIVRRAKIERSNRKGKKLKSTFYYDGKKRVVHFGAAGMEHYFDKSGLLSMYNHNDKRRRKAWRARFASINKKRPVYRNPLSAGYWSWWILW